MPTVTLRNAHPEDAATLAAISRRAFDSDIDVGAPRPGGPPGYNDPRWQESMMAAGDYLVLLVDGALVGGAIVLKTGPDEYELGRIFVDPARHRRGIGRRAITLLWEEYPHARHWTVDTPVWNQRTRQFYEALGFAEIGRRTDTGGPELVVFEKRCRQAL